MLDNLIFLNDQWFWPVTVCAGILLLVFIGKDWSQSGSRRLLLKSILAFFAIAALVLIALKPAVPAKETAGNFILLTEGYESGRLDSLRAKYKQLKVLDYSPGRSLPDDLKASENLYILGYGLKPYDLWQLEGAPAYYLGSPLPKGVVKVNYNQENFVGDRLLLKGLYQNPEEGNHIVLQGPGGTALDSVALTAEESQLFSLSAELKAEGNLVYSLVVKNSLGEVLTSDPVPVKVNAKNNLKVLIVNSFPTFETKYLKNFLGQAGHELVVRSQITRGRYKYEYFNTERIPVGSLTESTLEPFDLLVLDAGALQNLSAGEVNAIEKEVRESGLGIFIQPDESLFTGNGRLLPLNFDRVLGGEIRLSRWPNIGINRYPYRISDGFALQAIHTANNSYITAYRRLGQGRMGTTVLADTYRLLLEGHQEVYAALWSQIVEEVSRRAAPVAEWQQETGLAYKDEPFHFQLRTSLEDPVVQTGEGNIIPLMQDLNFPELWKGTIWPGETGWNQLQIDTTSVFNYYVAEENHWSSLEAQNILNENIRYFDQPVSAGEGLYPLEPIDPLWFYALFLFCIGSLWLEPKL